MAYQELPYPAPAVAVPAAAQRFIDAADRRCEAFYDAQLHKRYPRYVPSEPAQVYAALHYVSEQGLAIGETFLEWGSGFGVATGLAAQLGYAASGIEVQADLVDIATELLADQGLTAQLICSSYIPEGIIEYENFGTTDIVSDNFSQASEARPSYPDMDLGIDEIDLFFAYPWPGEQEMMLKLFDALAGEGAIFIAYFGDQDIHLYRKLDDPQ
ncbi:MAG: hypothetical protein ACPGTR_07910 [Opitutales bacterium]